LPCYNEADNLQALLRQFETLDLLSSDYLTLEVLVINDYSTDNTKMLVQSLQSTFSYELSYIEHDTNKGLTGGINTAIEYASKSENLLVWGMMDGDNSHNPLSISEMYLKILSGNDVVICSRYRYGSSIVGVSWWRQLLSLGLALIFKAIRNIRGVRDYSCGYRLYSQSILERLVMKYGKEIVKEKSFASMVELLVKCHIVGAVFTEVPMVLRYDKKLGISKMPFKKTIIGNLRILMTLKK